MCKLTFLKTFGSILFTVLLISACSSSTATPVHQEESPEPIADMANPAAVYCEGLGYSMENVNRNGGEDADCIFPDGSRCAQWDFLSGRCGKEFTYCEMQGFDLEEGTNIGNCRFTDNSFCDEFLSFSGECSPGDNPGEATIEIHDSSEARDYVAAYLLNQYGIEHTEPWREENITSENAAGATTFRYVSGLLTIVITFEASAPYPLMYTIDEATYIANGFYWEGTLSIDGQITENKVIPPATVLNEEQARDSVVDYLSDIYTLPTPIEWADKGFIQMEADAMVRAFTAGAWVAEVEFAPAAPLVSSYKVTIYNDAEGIRWEGDISLRGDIVEITSTE